MNIAVIIPAAGSSTRFAASAQAELGAEFARSKLDEDLGGRPVLHRTVELFNKHPDVTQIIVAGPHDDAAFKQFKDRHGDKLGLLGVRLCQGGQTHRFQTVAAALKLIADGGSFTHIAIHDAARPCASLDLIERIFAAAAQGHKAVVPGLDVPDTLKRVSGKDVAAQTDPLAAILGDSGTAKPLGRLVEETVDRSRLVAIQTPQIFELSLLRRAYAQKDLSSTDDAQLVERLGEPVLVVPGDAANIKLTRYSDLRLARSILNLKPPEGRPAHLRF